MSLELHINSTSLKWIFELHELLAQGKKQLNQWMNSMISKSCLVFWLVCTSHHFGAEGESVACNVCWIAHTASFVPFVVQRQLESWFRGESEDWSYRCWLRAFGQTNIGKELPAWGNFELRCGSSLLQVALDCHCSLAYSTRATFWSYTILFLPFVVQRQLESWFRGESEDWSYRCWLRAFGQTNIGKELPAWGNFELRCGSSLLQVALGCHCSFAYGARATFWSYTILFWSLRALCCWCWFRITAAKCPGLPLQFCYSARATFWSYTILFWSPGHFVMLMLI